MQRIVDMLEEEMGKSIKYTEKNFGSMIGDGFPELVTEVSTSSTVAMQLVAGMALTSLTCGALAEPLKNMPRDDRTAIGRVVRDNAALFQSPLGMLYWGIEIGKRLGKEQAESERQIEG